MEAAAMKALHLDTDYPAAHARQIADYAVEQIMQAAKSRGLVLPEGARQRLFGSMRLAVNYAASLAIPAKAAPDNGPL